MTWLSRTPVAVVRACVAMLPRLQAEESLQEATRTAVGTGSMKKEDSRAVHRSWADAALAGLKRPVAPATADGLSAAGIAVTIVPPAHP